MRFLLLLGLLLAACAGSQPAANTAAEAQASFDERTREQWKREEEQRQEREEREQQRKEREAEPAEAEAR